MKLFLLGGRPCSGKTTLANRLGKKYHIEVYSLDEFVQDCINHSNEENILLYRWKSLNIIELLQDEPINLFNDYIRIYEIILPDLLQTINTSKRNALLLEGSILLPQFIDYFKKQHDVRVCYLDTHDDFVTEKYLEREYAFNMLKSKNGQIAIKHLLERDSIFAQFINNEIEKNAFTKLMIDADSDIESVLRKLEAILEFNEQ